MKRMGAGRGMASAARVAFALMAPAVAGCAAYPRTPAQEVCVSSYATVQEAREAVEGALERISGMHLALADRLGKVKTEAGAAGNTEAARAVMETNLAFAEWAVDGMGNNMRMLSGGLFYAGDDAGRMGLLAQSACAALDSADATFESVMAILDGASGEMRAARGKE